MAWAAKRNLRAKRYTAYFQDERGTQRQKIGYTSKAATEDLARKLEDECRKIADGVVKRGERELRAAEAKPLADHIKDYRAVILSMGSTARHAGHIASVLRRLFVDASVVSLSDITRDKILGALSIWKGRGKSARTMNHALGAVKALVRWAVDAGRMEKPPEGLLKLSKYSEAIDPRLTRRALTKGELEALLEAAERGEPAIVAFGVTRSKHHATMITGPERAFLYRLAMATGFRANEIRTLTVEAFHLESDEPTITVSAKNAKNKKESVQPVTREMADAFRPFLAGKEPGSPVVPVPEKAAKLLRIDLDAAGITYGRKRNGKTAEGVIDFHALRVSYATALIESGANPRIVQILMRHSDIRLTLERYYRTTDAGVRAALNQGG